MEKGNRGWIKLHRTLFEEFTKERGALKTDLLLTYLYILAMANYEDFDGLKTGETIISASDICKINYHANSTTAKRCILRLDELGHISILERMVERGYPTFKVAVSAYVDNQPNINEINNLSENIVVDKSNEHKSNIKQTLVKHQTNIGQTLVKHKSNMDDVCNNLESNQNITPKTYHENIDQTLVKHWSNIEQTLVEHKSNIGQTLVANGGGCSYIEERNKEFKEEKKEEITTKKEFNTGSAKSVATRPIVAPPVKNLLSGLSDIVKNTPTAKVAKVDVIGKQKAKSHDVIAAYKDAYLSKYGTEPLINAMVNKQACNLIDRVGKEMAVDIVRFYLSHNNTYYLSRAHPLNLAVNDAEKLHTELKKGDYITTHDIKAIERATTEEKSNAELLRRHHEREAKKNG